MQPLVLIGTGGFGREAAEAVRAANDESARWDLLGFLDDDPSLAGREVDGLPVLGPALRLTSMPGIRAAVCTGSPANYFSRKRIVARLGLPPDRYATIVHPAAAVARSAALGPGTVLLAGAVLTASLEVGAHVAVMPGVVLTHDDAVGDYCTFGAGARLGGRVRVGEGAYVGSGALVREDTSIGAWALVGMGAVVVRDVPAAEVWTGVPARLLRRVDVPPDVAGALPAAGEA